MVVGKYLANIKFKSKFKKFIVSNLGILDLHTQMRTVPLMKYAQDNRRNIDGKNIVEIGCGNGKNCFEVYYIANPKHIVGFDFDTNAIESANKLSNELKVENQVQFFCENATKYDFSNIGNIDYLLLIDFLEHIDRPDLFLQFIKPLLNDTSTIIVSVPTYMYKKVFGQKFHIAVGHVKDGYNLSEIEDLFKTIGYKVKSHSYNTGLFGGLGCFLYYRFMIKNSNLNIIKQLLLYPFSKIDFINNENISSSLFVVLEKS